MGALRNFGPAQLALVRSVQYLTAEVSHPLEVPSEHLL